ncbi:hypothetical protein M0811_08696 [Anaeramoeba ignava]|uniref:Uncharacterized protein n=1 Tax=Anaeramoeba ignava TaxID=1746090 RepID=A0A9Q0LJJ0_ANAIG|nr:hypothetical protein M0811_08696 [Anaeramoeba ignava]
MKQKEKLIISKKDYFFILIYSKIQMKIHLLIHILSNQQNYSNSKIYQNIYPQVQMYVLFELKRMIINDVEIKEILNFFKNGDLQTLLIDLMINVLTFQDYFGYKFLFNQIFKNQNIKSNLSLLKIKAFEGIEEILFHSIQKQNKSIELCLKILDLLFQKADIEIILQNQELTISLIKLFKNKITQKISLTHIPKILEKQKFKWRKGESIHLFLFQNFIFNSRNQFKNKIKTKNQMKFNDIEELFQNVQNQFQKPRKKEKPTEKLLQILFDLMISNGKFFIRGIILLSETKYDKYYFGTLLPKSKGKMKKNLIKKQKPKSYLSNLFKSRKSNYWNQDFHLSKMVFFFFTQKYKIKLELEITIYIDGNQQKTII